MADRPNVLVLVDDEHRPDVLGYAGDDMVRTPNLDRLAEDACVFENAYTPSPVCSPARQCLRTGELPLTCGCPGWSGLDADAPTYPRRFAEYGYRTAAAGKSHFEGSDAFMGWDTRIGRTGSNESIDRQVDLDLRKNKWSDAKEIKRAGVGHHRGKQDEYAITGLEHYIERSFLDTYYDRCHPDRPTLLKASLVQPHYPYYASDEEAFQYYLNRVEPFVEEAPDHDGLAEREVTVGPDAEVTEREVRRATAAYYAMVEHADRQYGRVLDALERAGEDLDEWIIVFTSDHGEMLGEHGVWEKRSFYEASAGVPLFVRWPEHFEGKRIDANVTLTDLFATLCDLADLPVHDGEARDSRSLVPLLEGNDEEWDTRYPADEAVSAYVRRVMVKRGDLKYVHFPREPYDSDAVHFDPGPGERSFVVDEKAGGYDGGDVLFDLSEDPGERTNLVDDPAYAGVVSEFRDRVAELGYGPEADTGYTDAGYA
ncbi:MAG: sulfatase-like hydrolase/transferase [Halorhabdus sp.]